LLTILIVYLLLAAQFESFVHPAVIITTVPLAVAGGMIGLAIMGQTMNLYSQVGLVMLVGLAAKNGILIVEFANQLRDAGRDIGTAIREASRRRLRPILMTSIATVAGAVPLMLAGGAGAAARTAIGVVIVFGVSISTLITLFLIPLLYSRLARYTGSPLAVAGGIIGLAVMGQTLNLYSQVGIVMLVGLAAKNGILIVEFANQLRDQGRDIGQAIREASARRLRPILMTSIATVAGAVPLMLASGAGAAARTAIGVVIVWGVSISTLITLFLIPLLYSRLARYTGSPLAVTRKLEEQLNHPQPAPAE
ncbi:MAG: efflux RND transporter permease subunit, partial [Allosphingosinicella sp.]